jgi:DNA-binding CsgD family transcriptional regulator
MAELLSDKDLRVVTDLLSSAEPQADGRAGLPDAVLARLTDLVRCDTVTFLDIDVACETSYLDQTFDGWSVAAEGPICDPGAPFWRHYWSSAACSYPNRTGDLRSVTLLSDFVSQRQWHATPMYQDAQRGIDHEMMASLTLKGTRSTRVVFFRGPGSDFNERDRTVMALLRPHLREMHAAQKAVVTVADPAMPTLTPRQTELLRLVAAGLSTVEIAAALYLSPSTVRKHLENIFSRLGVTNRTAAVMRALGDEIPRQSTREPTLDMPVRRDRAS